MDDHYLLIFSSMVKQFDSETIVSSWRGGYYNNQTKKTKNVWRDLQMGISLLFDRVIKVPCLNNALMRCSI
jgi:hypothetical protein